MNRSNNVNLPVKADAAEMEGAHLKEKHFHHIFYFSISFTIWYLIFFFLHIIHDDILVFLTSRSGGSDGDWWRRDKGKSFREGNFVTENNIYTNTILYRFQ